MRRVKVKPDKILKETIHNKLGTLIVEREVNPPSGPIYFMWEVKLDNGGLIVLPKELFEEI